MPPVRTKDSTSTSTSQERPHKRRRVQQTQPAADSSAPGVSKLKASLRQTKRLLAKDTLAADVRVDTERRLHALEAELAAAEQANKERAMATKYHRIKFFDRKKLLRRVKQVQRQLGADELSDKERKKLERTLSHLRVDLNYVTHYPKAERYISLFPPEVRQQDGEDEPRAVEPIRLKKGEVPASETEKRREELRAWVRERMEAGEFAKEPEVGGSSGQERNRKAKSLAPPRQEDGEEDVTTEDESEERSDLVPVQSEKVEKRHKRANQADESEDDARPEHPKKSKRPQGESMPPAKKRKEKSARSKVGGKGEEEPAKTGLAGDDFFGED
ncbi:hypothetical protein PENSPDRAFT_648610 [Peniophora sp. CONT]|nr:hypothetical protein PENSPDRAFT_648610 [Peniophora sp. CONT]